MEIKFMSEVTGIEEVYKITEKLMLERRIDGINFISKEYWEKHQDVQCINILTNINTLSMEFWPYRTYDNLSKKFKLFILTKNFGPEFYYTILAIVYYE